MSGDGEPDGAGAPSLRAVVAGVELETEAARTLWQRFSAYMEEHRGDFAGFAAREGHAYAGTRFERGGAVLELAAQAPRATPQRERKKRREGARTRGHIVKKKKR